MKRTEITLIKLTASDGNYLTNGDIYSKEVYLGVNDEPENWREITAKEAEELQAVELSEEE